MIFRAYLTRRSIFLLLMTTLFAPVLFGCGSIQHDAFAEFTDSAIQLRDGTDEVLGVQYEWARERFLEDASKAAVVALATGLVDDHPRLIDVQWRTDHLATLGVTEIPRSRYLERLRAVLPSPEPRIFSDTSRTISHPLT